MIIGIDPDYDYLYDPQQARPVGWCRICKKEIYTPGRDVHEECEDG